MKSKKVKKIVILLIIILIIFVIFLLYDKIYLNYKIKPTIELNGDQELVINYNDIYEELGAKAYFRNKNISDKIVIENNINNKVVGEYVVNYSVNQYNNRSSVSRKVKIVDTTNPIINLKGSSELTLYVGDNYIEDGYEANDDYDGDITSKVIVTNNIDSSKAGVYEISYLVKDSSGNEVGSKRIVNYIEKKYNQKTLPSINSEATHIAVLNYHFFYDEAEGEAGKDGNFISKKNFEEQLSFLKRNGYKTLTIDEFKSWMYGEINLPARSVLITIDDGAAGTGIANGNKLIPLLEKYEANATLFLISGWWPKSNYESSYLDIESHTHDMHTESYCSDAKRGAKMLCLSDDLVLADLNASASTIGSNTAFAFPFYVYSDHTIELLKQSGFKIAFIGGDYKASRDINKYKIPRYHVYKTTTLDQFINMVS